MKVQTLDGPDLKYSVPTTLNDAMATAAAILNRRRHDRIELRLPARYMLADLSEHVCETIDVSPSGLRLKASSVVPWGSRVVAYVEGLGRVEGVVVRRARGWFAISLRLPAAKQQRLATKIEWLAERVSGDSDERRFVPRVDRDDENVMIRTDDHHEYQGELMDISMEGAALLVDAPLHLGQHVRLGAQDAEVIRLFPGGAAMRFI
jgi:hypothetical protein